jgi:class 3 adenylate cyclase
MDNIKRSLNNPLQYENRLRFPDDLESAYRIDFANRVVKMQRYFIVFGFILYGLFGILDYYAMPRTYHSAWILRALLEPFVALLFLATFKRYWQQHMYWLINLWMVGMNATILAMIALAQQSELAFTFYPIGLMLVLISGYVSSGHLGYATLQGWFAIIGYILVGIFDQRMLMGYTTLSRFFILNFFIFGLNIIGMMLGYSLERTNRLAFLQQLIIEQQNAETNELRAKSERLLLNVLPAPVAERLKRGETVADYYENAAILFADIENFTPFSANRTPAEVVEVLNQIFSAFDQLSEKHSLEKIKTIGDDYMVVSGVPIPRSGYLEALVEMAFEMQNIMENFRQEKLCDFNLRIGINTGPVVAGIIGNKKFSYDLWGDTVNVASRMEAYGLPGRIQVTEEVFQKLKHKYHFEKRGKISIKGRGKMIVYFLSDKKIIDNTHN